MPAIKSRARAGQNEQEFKSPKQGNIFVTGPHVTVKDESSKM